MGRILRSTSVALVLIAGLLLASCPPPQLRAQAVQRVYLPLLATTNAVKNDRFAIAIDATVSEGMPQPGAGAIETPAGADTYTFTAEAGRQVILDVLRKAPALASTRWRLVNEAGAAVFDRTLGDTGIVTLASAGTYTLVVGGEASGGTGAYAFKLIGLPLPGRFAISIGDTVSDGAPGQGAGKVEEAFGKDFYTFTAAAGQRVLFDLQNVAVTLSDIRWRLLAPNGSVIFDKPLGYSGGFDPGVFTMPAAGIYTLVVGSDTNGGTGAYGFQLRNPPALQQFAIAVGDTVSDGVPAAGAGKIEEPFGQDSYTFAAAAGQRVIFASRNVADALAAMNWRLVAPGGGVVFDRTLGPTDPAVFALPAAGTYELVVRDDLEGSAGTYGFQLRTPPVPDQFAIVIGDTVSNGVPAVGAGNIEASFGQDIYTFPAAAGQRVVFHLQSLADELKPVDVQVVGPDGRIVFDDTRYSAFQSVFTAPAAGTYALRIGSDTSAGTGAYGFQLRAAPSPQQFTIVIGNTVSDGVPAVGAGNIEGSFDQDVYTFPAAAGQRVVFDIEDENNTLDEVRWRLLTPDGSTIFNDSVGFSSARLYTLPAAGTYTLLVGGSNPGSGTYQMRLSAPPAPQQFALVLGDAVSDGVPAAGAGNIEEPFAQDVYTFTAGAGQRVVFDIDTNGALGGVNWKLLAPDGSPLLDNRLGFNNVSTYLLRSAGSYSVLIGGNGTPETGTYSLQLRAAPAPQQFAIAIGATVPDDVPGPGAGSIEELFGLDGYTFFGTTGQRVYVEVLDAAGALSGVRWRLVAPNGTILLDHPLDPDTPGIRTLAASGTYTILVGGDSASGTGAYRLRLGSLPAPQEFAVAIGDTIADGAPAAGAGKIEEPFGQDVYTFEGVAGQRVMFDVLDAAAALAEVSWWLVAPGGGIVLTGSLGSSFAFPYQLRAVGTYTLVIGGNSNSGTGSYQLRLGSVAAPQQFAIAVGDTVSNGVPGVGAGNIEESFGRDSYTFSAAAGQRVFFEVLNEAATLGGLDWQLLAPNGSRLLDSSSYSVGSRIYTLRAAGDYTLLVGNDFGAGTGTYELRIGAVPVPQRFAIAVGDTVSNGVPGVGAGNIEASFGQDVYTFEGVAGQNVRFEVLAATVGYEWRLVAPDGSVVFTALIATIFGLDEADHTLPATGTYTLTVSSDLFPATSTYSFRTTQL